MLACRAPGGQVFGLAGNDPCGDARNGSFVGDQAACAVACARCDFYTPKDSSHAQLLEAKANLQHMLASIPLTDDERAAVEDRQAALSPLLDRLADTPTPAGATPRQIRAPATATTLPIIDVRRGKTGQP